MRYLRTLAAASALALTVACTEETSRDLTAPDTNTPVTVQPTAPISSAYCTAKTDVGILADIDTLYFKNQWPDPNSAKSKFGQVTNALDASDTTAAILATRSLIAFVTNKYEHLSSPTQEQTDLYNELIADLWCFVGISGQVFDLNPDDPAKAFTIPGVGGVWFPAGAVPVGTMVVLTDISDLEESPLSGPLDHFSSYIDIQLIPAHTFTGTGLDLPVVVVCPEDEDLTGLFLAHEAPGGYELLPPPEFIPTELAGVCGEDSGQNGAPQGWLAHWVERASALLLPRPLQASMMVVGGIGGSPSEFSPFGTSQATVQGTNGVGGSAGEFSPRPQAGPAATPPVYALEGVVSAAPTFGAPTPPANWPVVTVQTLGLDGDVNPIQDVTVAFSIGPATTYDPDSQAELCDAGGNVPSSDTVYVPTDANGVATLPCIRFGTVAGYANLKATFDPSTIGFTGAELITVNTLDVNEGSSTSLNWLVKSNAGPAASILTSMPPALDAATYTYPGFVTFNVPVSVVPRAIVKDQYSNVIEGLPVTWTPVNSQVNGGTIPVNTSTNASGFATVSSWTPGPGEATLVATVSGVANPATYTAFSAIGASAYMCELGAAPYDLDFRTVGGNINKVDLAPIKVKDPNSNVFDVFLYMSVTGQSSTFSTYTVNMNVYRTASNATTPGSTLVGSATGETIGLPGNNGKPQFQHIKLNQPVAAATGNNLLWFVVTVVNPPGGRTFQAWYTNVASNKQSNACKLSFIGTGSSPKQGVALVLMK